MTKLTHRRARRVARSDAEAAAKIIAVQEAQIEALKAETVCELYGLWDYVDPATGEVVTGKSKRPS